MIKSLALTVATAVSSAAIGQVVVINDDSLTTLRYASPSAGQNIRALVTQRGTGIDGVLRSPATQGWALGANPFGEPLSGRERLGAMNLVTGTYQPTEVDIALPSPGASAWVIGRSFNHRQETSGPAHHDSNGRQGFNWFQNSQSEIVLYVNSGDHTKDVIYLIDGAHGFKEFQRTGASSDTYKGVNGATGVIRYNTAVTHGEPTEYILTTSHGVQITYFGFVNAGSAAGQIWKIEDPAGNRAYVGHPTVGSTAISSGYSGSQISVAYDGANRRYCYIPTGSAIGGVVRLAEVIVEVDAGGGWDGCGCETEVARVEYEYYDDDNDDHGMAGDLKLVTVTTPLTDSGVSRVRKQYYRYYDDTWADADGTRGEPHCIKMVVDPDGYDRYDLDQDGTRDDDPQSASDTNLKAYSAVYMETVSASDYRVASVFFNGECGCSSPVNGTTEFTYEDNADYTDNSGYDQKWCTRTIAEYSDGTHITDYADEAAQPLSRVITDAAPTQTVPAAPNRWVTQVIRDSSGFVSEIRTPEANDAYWHVTAGMDLAGKITGLSSAGLISTFTRYSSGDKTGYIEYRKHKKGTSGTAYPDSFTDYTTSTMTVSSSSVVRPSISTTRAYRETTETGSDIYDETTFAYSYWSGTASSVLILTPKSIVATYPKVSAGNNGAGTGGGDPAVQVARYLRKDGTTAFSVRPAYSNAATTSLVWDYTTFTNGQLTGRVADVKMSGSFPSGEDPNTDFGITEPSSMADLGQDVASSMTYDAQGRMATSTQTDGRVSHMYYSRLLDHRGVAISVPRVTTGGSTTFYGPLSYAVMNHAGRAEFSGTIAIPAAGITTAKTGWIDEGDADAISAVDIGQIRQLTRSIYNEPGAQLDETRVYVSIPASIGGESAANYDKTLYGYDVRGRQNRRVTPAGTITATIFDKLGRTVETHMGTDDGMSSDMTKTMELEYDGGNDNGNSKVTTRTIIVAESPSGGTAFDDDRVTTYTYDYRNRLLLTNNPVGPDTLLKLDNLGRVLAVGQYNGIANITVGSTDPAATGTQTDRIGLSTTTYDEMGRVCATARFNINQGNGTDTDSLTTAAWYDAQSRVVKSLGTELTKAAFDRLGRGTHSYTLAKVNDSTYAHAMDVSGDHVLEERQTVYESKDSNNVVMRVHLSRHFDDLSSGTTGALDSNADGNPLIVTAADCTAWVQIDATWYDDLDRARTVAQFGTCGGSDFNRGTTSEPSVSASDKIVSLISYVYDVSTVDYDDGRVHQTTDPRGKKTRTVFDAMGRKTLTIANYVNGAPSGETGDDDVHTRFVYEDGHLTKMWVDYDGDNVVDTSAPKDQVTTYIYGATKGTPAAMAIASGDLLRAVKYPDSTNTGTVSGDIDGTSDDDVVSYAYNAQGQRTYTKDQAGNEIVERYDTGGRLVHRMAVTGSPPSGYDYTIKRISTAWDPRGMVASVTQFTTTTIGSPDTSNIRDQVAYAYDGWGNLTTLTQDPDSAVGGGGRGSLAVGYTWAKNAGGGTNGPNVLRCTELEYPDGTDVSYDYLTAGARLDGPASRVTRVRMGMVTLEAYAYMGQSRLVDIVHPTTAITSYLYDAMNPGAYDKIDRWGRVTKSLWASGLGTAFYDVDLTYDASSNITSVKDNIHRAAAGTHLWDAAYAVDGLNRVTSADEGELTGASITTRSRIESWTLGQPGTHRSRWLDLTGGPSPNYTDAGEFKEDRTFNEANELTQRGVDTNNTAGYEQTYSPVHDDTGNLIDDGMVARVFDPFGRLTELRTISNASQLVARYTYNGVNHLTSRVWDNAVALGQPDDGTVDGDDFTFFYAYDASWRLIAEYRESDTDAKKRHIYRNAGLGGTGGSSYIDAVILTDSDETNPLTDNADGTLETRRFLCQNWRGDVVAVVSDAGFLVEWVKYSAYGEALRIRAGDSDGDRDYDAADKARITGWTTGYDARWDLDMDGSITSGDATWADTVNGGGFGSAPIRGDLSGVGNRFGYAAYQFEPFVLGTDYLARHRWYLPGLAAWASRDPMGYVDGMDLYAYVGNSPIVMTDPRGTYCTMSDRGIAAYSSTKSYAHMQPISPPTSPLPSSCAWAGTSYATCTACCNTTAAANPTLPGWWVQECRAACSWSSVPEPNRLLIQQQCRQFEPWSFGPDCGRSQGEWIVYLHPDWAAHVAKCRQVARDVSDLRQPPCPTWQGANQTRHCVLACCLKRALGEENAWQVLNFHECCTFNIGTNNWDDYVVDMRANNLGIACANEAGNSCIECCPSCHSTQ